MLTSLAEMIVRSAAAGLALQADDGGMPAGHNGAHGDPETPVRNTGHWMMIWNFAARATGDERFRRAAERAADLVMQPVWRPHGYTFHHRDRAGKDRCNGLMGPAFSLEVLADGIEQLDRADMATLAARLIELHPYDESHGLWRVREIDGGVLDFDFTLNHQIWFAAAISLCNRAGVEAGRDAVRHFVDALDRTMILRPNGRIRHLSGRPGERDLIARLRARLAALKARPEAEDKARRREIAYHCFNLYPLAILRRTVPEAAFWRSPKLERAIAYLDHAEYQDAAADPGFVHPYIPAGFPLAFAERAFVDQVFGPGDPAKQRRLIEQQFDRTFDFERDLMTVNSPDPDTQAARSYEMTRLGDVAIFL